MEIAIKTPKTKNKIIDYQNEGKVIKSLEGEYFYPILYHYSDTFFLDKLEITLFGPNLLDLFNFSKGFDRKTILNIFENLLHKIQYMSEKGVVHRDIKLENIVWGMMNNSKITNKNEMYFIDYGFGISLQEIEQKVKKGINHWRCGTPRYMSINNHKNIKPSTSDDIESLLYTVMYLANIKLP